MKQGQKRPHFKKKVIIAICLFNAGSLGDMDLMSELWHFFHDGN